MREHVSRVRASCRAAAKRKTSRSLNLPAKTGKIPASTIPRNVFTLAIRLRIRTGRKRHRHRPYLRNWESGCDWSHGEGRWMNIRPNPVRVIELGNFEVDRSEARDREILINLSLLGTPLLIMDGTYIWVNGASWFDASTPTEIDIS